MYCHETSKDSYENWGIFTVWVKGNNSDSEEMGPASKTPGSIVPPHGQVDAAVVFKPKAGMKK